LWQNSTMIKPAPLLADFGSAAQTRHNRSIAKGITALARQAISADPSGAPLAIGAKTQSHEALSRRAR
jgi:hypothetical protein